MSNKKFLKCGVYLPPQLFDQIRSEAEHLGVSVSEFLRSLVIGYFSGTHKNGGFLGDHTVHTGCTHSVTQCTQGADSQKKTQIQDQDFCSDQKISKTTNAVRESSENWNVEKAAMRKKVKRYVKDNGPIEDYDDDQSTDLLNELDVMIAARYRKNGPQTPKEVLSHEVYSIIFEGKEDYENICFD